MLVEMGDLPKPDPKVLMSSLFKSASNKHENGDKTSAEGSWGGTAGDNGQSDESKKRKMDQIEGGITAPIDTTETVKVHRPSFL